MSFTLTRWDNGSVTFSAAPVGKFESSVVDIHVPVPDDQLDPRSGPTFLMWPYSLVKWGIKHLGTTQTETEALNPKQVLNK